jgi:hypothetical protein
LSIVIAILTLVLVAAVVLVVSAPLRSPREGQRPRSATAAAPTAPTERRRDLEAAREAKYREIRDAELDYRTGKLSREDYEAIDRELRGEAIRILDGLESEDA